MGNDAAASAGEVTAAAENTEVESIEPTDEADASETEDRDDSDESRDQNETDGDAVAAAVAKPPMSPVRMALICGLVVVLALSGLVGWLGFSAYQTHKAKEQRDLFLQVGRQGAVNLTTIDFEHVDDDVKRILDSATGQFYDEFEQRAQPFAEVVKQVKSKSVGTVNEAGLVGTDADLASKVPTEGEVLVAVTVNSSVAGQPDQAPRAWRMLITVQSVGGGDAKVSKVDFVS